MRGKWSIMNTKMIATRDIVTLSLAVFVIPIAFDSSLPGSCLLRVWAIIFQEKYIRQINGNTPSSTKFHIPRTKKE